MAKAKNLRGFLKSLPGKWPGQKTPAKPKTPAKKPTYRGTTSSFRGSWKTAPKKRGKK